MKTNNVRRGASRLPEVKQKVKREKKSYVPIFNQMVQIIFVILTIVLMYEVWIYILKPIVTLPIAKVEIISLSEEVDNNEIDRIVSDAIKDNSVFTVDVNNIITNINALPWVKSVHFIRKYPDFLSIEVDSQSPVAKWGEKELLSDSNNVYNTPDSNNYDYLPTIYTNDINKKIILDQYKLFSFALKPLKHDIHSLIYNDNGASTIILNNGVKINIGKNEYAKKIQNLISIYNKELSDKFENVDYIDLRYRQGIAVKFKENTETSKTKI